MNARRTLIVIAVTMAAPAPPTLAGWSEVTSRYLDVGAAGDRFGYSVAIQDDLLVVDAPNFDGIGTDSGLVTTRALSARGSRAGVFPDPGSSWGCVRARTRRGAWGPRGEDPGSSAPGPGLGRSGPSNNLIGTSHRKRGSSTHPTASPTIRKTWFMQSCYNIFESGPSGTRRARPAVASPALPGSHRRRGDRPT